MDEQDVLRRLERLEKALEVFSKRLNDMKKLGFPYISKLADDLNRELNS
jgi:hypothetical protein